MKRIFAVILTVTLILSLFVSCSDSGDTDESTAESTADDNSTTGSTSLVGELDIPDEQFDGYEFVIFTGAPVYINYCEADFEEPSDDAYENALYRRNRTVEDQLGVDIQQYTVVREDRFNTYSTEVLADSQDFNVAFMATFQAANAVFTGLTLDINEYIYIDLTEDWWDSASVEQLTIAGETHMVAGEVLYSDKECIWMQFFMKDVIRDFGLENPYQLVDSGEWTMDKMIEMMNVASTDVDGNGIMLSNDLFGLVTHGENYPALWIASGETLVKITDEGDFELTWSTERFNNVYEKIQTLMGNRENVTNNMSYIVQSMLTKRTLFANAVTSDIKGSLRDGEYDFGIIPLPKYDSDQAEYYTMVAAQSDLMVIPLTNADPYTDSIILEALAYYGKEIMLPTYYDKQITYRLLRDEDSGRMLDIIFNNRVYDLGVLTNWGDVCQALKSNTENVATLWASKESEMRSAMDEAIAELNKNK